MSDDFQQRGGSPWGTPPGKGSGNGSGRGPTPPDIEKIIREFCLLKFFNDLNKAKAIIVIIGSKYSCIKGQSNSDINIKKLIIIISNLLSK